MSGKDIKFVLLVAAGLAVGGVVFHYGRDLPVIRDAREGFNV